MSAKKVAKKVRWCWRKDLSEFRGLSDQDKAGFLLVLAWFENGFGGSARPLTPRAVDRLADSERPLRSSASTTEIDLHVAMTASAPDAATRGTR